YEAPRGKSRRDSSSAVNCTHIPYPARIHSAPAAGEAANVAALVTRPKSRRRGSTAPPICGGANLPVRGNYPSGANETNGAAISAGQGLMHRVEQVMKTAH